MTEIQQKWFNKYINNLTMAGRSIKNIKYSLKLFFTYLNETGLDFLRLRINQAQDFQGHLVTQTDRKSNVKYTKRSVGTIIGSITGFYIYLKKQKVIYSNPFLEVKKIRTEKMLPKNILNEEKMSKFLNHLKCFWKGKSLTERKQLYKAHVISELMYSSGMRINEIMKLKNDDIDFTRGTIRIIDSKSRQIRDGLLNEYCQKILRIYVEQVKGYILFGKNNGDLNLLFGSKNNLKIWLNTLLNKKTKRLKLGSFSSHHFRHAVGYHLLRGGCDIRYIQDILGHKALSSTQIYTKVDKEDLRGIIDKYHHRTFRSR